MPSTTELISRVFNRPTAPFFEGWVLEEIESILSQNRVPYFYDSSRNLIAGAANPRQLKKARVGFIAHTDHPGFHVQKSLGKNRYRALWYGGAPFKQMVGAKVAIYHPLQPDCKAAGIISRFKHQTYTREGMDFEIKTRHPLPCVEGSFGAFDFPAVNLKKTLVHTRVADDLAGVVIILGLLIDLKKHLHKSNVVGIFTRAEEVGYVGCWSLLQSKILPKNINLVSLEASRALPGAEIGKGPVMRIGDASTIFTSDLSILLWETAKAAKVPFQRRLMDGGSCEATAANLFGYKTTGVSVPLGNYHNQGPKGPKPEVVDIRDVDNARKICALFAKKFLKPVKSPHKMRFAFLQKNYKTLLPLLNQRITI